MWELQSPKHTSIDAKRVTCAKSGWVTRHEVNLVGEVDGIKREGEMAVDMPFERCIYDGMGGNFLAFGNASLSWLGTHVAVYTYTYVGLKAFVLKA